MDESEGSKHLKAPGGSGNAVYPVRLVAWRAEREAIGSAMT